MKTRKATAFWTTLLTLIILFVVSALKEQLASVGQIIVIMVVGNAATYIGGQVADSWQKSKYYRAELDTNAGGANPTQGQVG